MSKETWDDEPKIVTVLAVLSVTVHVTTPGFPDGIAIPFEQTAMVSVPMRLFQVTFMTGTVATHMLNVIL